MHKFILSVLIAAVAATSSCAQTVGDMFVNIPDSLFPYLKKEKRMELLSLKKVDNTTKAVLRSDFNCEIVLDSLSEEFIKLNIDSTVMLEMSRLKFIDGDSLYCMLRTVSAPEKETNAAIYDRSWIKRKELLFDNVQFLQRPDTMSEENFSELKQLIEFRMIEAHFNDSKTIELRMNIPMVSKSERERLECVLMQRKLKWDGKIYKID